MLAIRMQRTGRKGHAMFRVIVQDSRLTPTSGKVVATLGNYDPHAKKVTLDKEKATFYLDHGAQPSDRIARLLKNEGLKLPSWVSLSADKERAVRHPDKRRSTQPEVPVTEPVSDETPVEAEPAAPIAEVEPVVEASTPEVVDDAKATPAEVVAEEVSEVAADTPVASESEAVVENPTEESAPKAKV